MTPDLPRFIGHRGAAAQAPENTLAGLRKADELGFPWVEFDVRLTRDGRLVLIHDATLERTTDGRGRVAETDFADIRTLDAGNWFAPDFRGERVPAVEEALELLRETGLGANIEMKCDPGMEAETAGALAAALRGRHPGAPLLISSFETACLAAFRDAAPDLPMGLLLRRWQADWRAAFDSLTCLTLNLGNRGLTRRQVQQVTATGTPLLVYTVNDPRRARTLFRWGVTGIFTDGPPAIAALARQKNP